MPRFTPSTAPPEAGQATGLAPARVRRIQAALLGWYREHGQPFPWREARDPYAAMVAAVCAQQTQMARVLPLYERWMSAFPTVRAAAEASPEAVLRAWGRGGYPRRALNLREAARICMEQHGGALPREAEELLALPGVGPFTAAIIRCFGFGEDAPAIDTNVIRVLGRVVHGDLQPARETSAAAIHVTAARLLPPGEAGVWNPALMDFGARVCTARPRCAACPLARLCAARPRFEAGGAAEPLRAQPRFEGSDRQWRGRILRHLREQAGPVRTAVLLDAITAIPEERARALGLIEALAREGFVWSRGGRCGLGQAP